MSTESRSAYDVFKEKYEDRGWSLENDYETRKNSPEQINRLPFSEEEYRVFCLLLSKLASYDKDPDLCETYFNIQRRAINANGYSMIDELSQVEKEMWSLGTGEIIEDAPKIL